MDISQQAVLKTAAGVLQSTRKVGRFLHVLKPGLRFHLLFVVIGVALITLLASIYILFSFQRTQLIENARASSAALSNLVEANLFHAMQTDDWSMINDIIQLAVAERTIDTLRIVNTQGDVLASSDLSELSASFDLQDNLCQQCHAAGDRTFNKIGEYASDTGQQVLFSVNLINNQPECWVCHGVEQGVLGLLIIETPLTLMNNQLISGFWRTTLIALIACALLVGMLVPVLNHFVIRPVGVLSKGVDELTSGNLEYAVIPVNQDELGKLAESFDHMRLQLKDSYTEISRREKEAVTLYELGTKISASLEQSELLHSVAEAARELLSADIGFVGLFSEASREIIIKAAAGAGAEAHTGMSMPVCPGTPGDALLKGLPVIAEAYDQNNLLHFGSSLVAEERIVSALAVPLKLGESFLGMIQVMSRERRQFTQADAQLLMRLGYHVVVAIENAQLYQQLRYLATLEERDRLGREMHDHLAQILGYLNVRATMTDDLLSNGRTPEAKESLAELKRVAKIAYTDVREQIFNLRTSVSPRIGLLPTLQEYLAEYHTHYGLETRLVYEHESLTEFPSEVASQLLRIIQEALTNVRKHAGASQACIRFAHERGIVCIHVEDDGHGFPTDQPGDAKQQSYGLQIMRERAESVGGSLNLDSKPGKGTRVTVCIPAVSRN